MKRIYINIMSAFCLAAAALSCNDAFLECPPRDEMTDATFWQTA